MDKTIGEKRVRAGFNPSESELVQAIKAGTAAMIDICEDNKENDPRLCALAQTAFEEAAMWAVKLATAKL